MIQTLMEIFMIDHRKTTSCQQDANNVTKYLIKYYKRDSPRYVTLGEKIWMIKSQLSCGSITRNINNRLDIHHSN